MKRKPKGNKSRNLSARGGAIYYERLVGGRRIRFSTMTDDWEIAASVRDEFEEQKRIGKVPFLPAEAPRFEEFAHLYLNNDTAHLAPTTRSDRSSYLRVDGPLMGFFGDLRLDAIDATLLFKWWGAEIESRGLSPKTGRAYLDVLSAILGYAINLGILDASPIAAAREVLRRRSRTKQGRADADASSRIRPIEHPEEIRRLVKAAMEEGREAHALVLLCLDSGLRLGEALGLRWGSIVWGGDDSDSNRRLRIVEARPRGGDAVLPKSGRAREVALSHRLRNALADLYRERFEPGSDALVLNGIDPGNFRAREWRRILKRAGIGHRAIKDLRDTFASQLLTAGIQLGYVSEQLGHSDVSVTARHYARWAGGGSYRAPMSVEPGEVPADLLARIDSPQSPPSMETAESGFRPTLGRYDDIWRAGRDSNPRPSGSKPDALSS